MQQDDYFALIKAAIRQVDDYHLTRQPQMLAGSSLGQPLDTALGDQDKRAQGLSARLPRRQLQLALLPQVNVSHCATNRA